MRISALPIKHPCHYGIDMSTREEMRSPTTCMTAEVAAELGCAPPHHLSLEGVYEVVGATRATHCDACFTATTRLPAATAPVARDPLEQGGLEPVAALAGEG